MIKKKTKTVSSEARELCKMSWANGSGDEGCVRGVRGLADGERERADTGRAELSTHIDGVNMM